jgi:hypothetical protein
MIANLTQHAATADQITAGVRDMSADAKAALSALLTFVELPTGDDLRQRADAVVALLLDASDETPTTAMVGGAPYFMAPLVEALTNYGIRAVYSFTRRESVEFVNPDGSVSKTAVFRHIGWVEA